MRAILDQIHVDLSDMPAVESNNDRNWEGNMIWL